MRNHGAMKVNWLVWTHPGEKPSRWAQVGIDDDDGNRLPPLLVRAAEGPSGVMIDRVMITLGEDRDLQAFRDIPVRRLEILLGDLKESIESGTEFRIDLGEEDPLTRTIDQVTSFIPSGDAQRVFKGGEKRTRSPLTRPGRAGDDDFYRRVSDAYLEAMMTTRAVAPVLAAEADVPVRTVHGWIREARRRGFLPPARQVGA